MSFAAAVGLINCDLLFSGVPRLPREGEEIFSEGFRVAFGGGVPAIMLSLSRLNVPVRLGTYLGKDLFSDFARRELDASGVAWRNLYEGDGVPLTITAVAITKNDRTFLSSTAASRKSDALAGKAYEVMRGAKVVRMGMTGALQPVYRRLKDEGTVLVLDTGWDEEMSLDRYAPFLELADYYLPNRVEATRLTGEETAQGAAKKLSKYFDKTVVKLDGEGCYLLDKDGERVVSPLPSVKAVDATGAGDAFCAGFMYGLYHDMDFTTCARLGNVMGGLCVQEIGCVTRAVREEELTSLLPQIGVKESRP